MDCQAQAAVGKNFKIPSVDLTSALPEKSAQGLSLAESLPSSNVDESEVSSSGGWLCIVNRSKPRLLSTSRSGSKSIHPVTSSQFAEEDDLIKAA